MENDIKKIQDDFIEMVGNLCASINITRIIGQIYALLYMSEEPVSMDEIVKRLNVSKGNVSVNINILEDWDAVSKVWVKGSRKNFYTADPDIWKLIKERIKTGLSRRIERTSNSMDEINNSMKDIKEKKSEMSFYNERLGRINELKNKLSAILSTFSDLDV